MKARIVPLYLKSANDSEFEAQLGKLKQLLINEADLLPPVKLGARVPPADAVIFPQMLGEAYGLLEKFKRLPQPLLVVTSEFGTVSMWDWEINSFLTARGVRVIGPTSLEKTRQACRAFALKRQLKRSKLLVFQDHPASQGQQDPIFKRFYWWEPQCVQEIETRYGVKVVKRSFKKLAAAARAIPEEAARAEWARRKGRTPISRLKDSAVLSAVKMYLAVKAELDRDPSVIAVGINCLNESMYSDTTPCLAWNFLFEDQRMVWGCEADLISMLTKILIGKTLGVPFMMTNLYPFEMGDAALKHEHIPHFPPVDGRTEDHILAAHCGYLGVVPQSFSTEWRLKPKVLAIVDDNATAIDARLAEGEITLVKLMPPFDRWSVVEGALPKYAGFKNSHCLNGAVIRVPNGKRLVADLVSHHYILTIGHNLEDLRTISKVFDLECVSN